MNRAIAVLIIVLAAFSGLATAGDDRATTTLVILSANPLIERSDLDSEEYLTNYLLTSPPGFVERYIASIDSELTIANSKLQELIKKGDTVRTEPVIERIKSLTAERESALFQLYEKTKGTDYDSLTLIQADVLKYERGKSDKGYDEAANRALALADKIDKEYNAPGNDGKTRFQKYEEYKVIDNQIYEFVKSFKDNGLITKGGQGISFSEDIFEDTENLKKLDELEAKQKELSLTPVDIFKIESDLNTEKELRQAAESFSARGNWFLNLGGGTWKQVLEGKWYGSKVGDLAQGLANLGGQYRALSNLLIPDKFMEGYLIVANNEVFRTFANLPSFIATTGAVFGFDYCSIDDAKKSGQPGQNYVFAETVSGIRQPVAQISAEMSDGEVYSACTADAEGKLGCKQNSDGSNQVCKADKFCYSSRDAVEPIKARFYKITWGVGVPADSSFTPYVDEAGKAVKFNIMFKGSGINRYLYTRGTEQATSVLSLENGATDGATIAFYSQHAYTEACIDFNENHRMKTFTNFGGEELVDDLCAEIVQKAYDKTGPVEFLDSKRQEPSVTTKTAEVTTNNDI
ncbi:MAG TPA: hypothetical protein VJH68_02365 [Candidatus Nanoarchaeia archaeon]|nr:hypothetical protein [Candidatus Nanoarchaeia archaeon]